MEGEENLRFNCGLEVYISSEEVKAKEGLDFNDPNKGIKPPQGITGCLMKTVQPVKGTAGILKISHNMQAENVKGFLWKQSEPRERKGFGCGCAGAWDLL